VREFLAGELGQGLGNVRAIFYETPVHVTHSQKALELRQVARGKRLRQALDVLLVHQQLAWTDNMPQVLAFLLEQVTLGGIKRDIGLLQQEEDFTEVPGVIFRCP